jgi:acyl-CoA synthetase (AMP-forming)/AMP-acid ligase II
LKSKADVVRDWQRTLSEIEAKSLPASLPALVDRSAQLYGNRVAWSFFERGEHVTFTDAQQLSLRAAAALRKWGIHRGVNVAVMVENSPAFLIAWIALARLGAAIVPINTRYTSRELEHVLRLSQAKLLVVDIALLPVAEELQDRVDVIREGRVITVGGPPSTSDWATALASTESMEIDDTAANLDDVVNIQFTSGTTGFPKGCILTQRYWVQAAVSWGEYLGNSVRNAILNQRLFYIDGQFLALACLYMGTTYHICSKPSAAKFGRWLREFQIDYCWYAEPLFKTPPEEGDMVGALRLIHIFGFAPANHAALERRYGAIARESYGMSECAPILIMPLDAEVMVGSGSCGLNAPLTELKIVGEDGKQVVQGDIGELLIKSPSMLRGYYGDGIATAQTIEDGWLKTGDLFRQDEEGFFYIVGRKKDMVRRNSENISCREVEEVIRQIPGVLEAAMVPVKDSMVGEEPKVYIQLQDGFSAANVTPKVIIDFCLKQLAPFKTPRYIEYVNEFPLTESARVSKKAMIANVKDLRVGSFDVREETWILQPEDEDTH